METLLLPLTTDTQEGEVFGGSVEPVPIFGGSIAKEIRLSTGSGLAPQAVPGRLAGPVDVEEIASISFSIDSSSDLISESSMAAMQIAGAAFTDVAPVPLNKPRSGAAGRAVGAVVLRRVENSIFLPQQLQMETLSRGTSVYRQGEGRRSF
ncbi:hypothetical protein AAFF_G00246950 [Aldrovandia affinis]|uniref:Uncharacterized protein n=1 Tax=Aldrovandia affinis TaxID=143900 RepID=A0AAD7SVD9_9TELE|nr:hypothetical protein AAFF_G00246950 [Aldrovandia affinis]